MKIDLTTILVSAVIGYAVTKWLDSKNAAVSPSRFYTDPATGQSFYVDATDPRYAQAREIDWEH